MVVVGGGSEWGTLHASSHPSLQEQSEGDFPHRWGQGGLAKLINFSRRHKKPNSNFPNFKVLTLNHRFSATLTQQSWCCSQLSDSYRNKMPQCNFFNKISLPKLAGLQLPTVLSTPRPKHSGARLQRSGAFSGLACRGRARPALDQAGPGQAARPREPTPPSCAVGFLAKRGLGCFHFYFQGDSAAESLSCLLHLSLCISLLQKWLHKGILNRFMSGLGVKSVLSARTRDSGWRLPLWALGCSFFCQNGLKYIKESTEVEAHT